MAVIYYCHRNAVHHGFVTDLREWEFSSYHSIVANDSSIVSTTEVIKRFGSISSFEEAHKGRMAQIELEKYSIEV